MVQYVHYCCRPSESSAYAYAYAYAQGSKRFIKLYDNYIHA